MKEEKIDLVTNHEVLQTFKNKVDNSNFPAILCSNYIEDNPNFYGIIHSNHDFESEFGISHGDLIGKSYDFLFENHESDYSTEDQIYLTKLLNSIKLKEDCQIKQTIFNQNTLEKEIYEVRSYSAECEETRRSYIIFTYKKQSSSHESKISNIKKENIALKNQSLVRSLERALGNEKILRDISYQIISDRSVKDIAYHICESICKMLKVDHCVIHNIDSDNNIQHIVEYCSDKNTSNIYNEDEIRDYLTKQTLFHQKICRNTDKTSIFINSDVDNSPHYDTHNQFYKKYNIKSQICAISFFNNKPNGGIYVHSSTNRNPTIDEVEMIEIITDQLSIAIERSRSIEKIIFANHELLQKTKQLKKSVQKEKEMREMQSKFITLVSHEFKTPLQIIDSTRELISRKIKSLGLYDESFDKYSSRVKNAINRMTNLINSTLNLAKTEDSSENQVTTYKTDFYIHDLLRDVIGKISDLSIKRNISIKSIYNAKDDYINADSNLLEHCFSNIISNAIKYSKKDTDVLIKTNSDNKNISISIEDQGIGIPKQDLDRIGQKFFRSSNTLSESGTGIGLYLTKYFIELHNGYVNIESEENKGTKVTITLPKL